MARISIPDAETYKALRLPHFDGFPYLATYVVPTVYHIILLPSGLDKEEMTRIAVRQATANRLETCLVLGEDSCVYFGTDGSAAPSDCVPGCTNWITDKLLPGSIFIENEELKERKERLLAFIKANTQGGYLMGDLTKGGRPATEEELARLAGSSAMGIPKGLSQCGVCGGWRGVCLDPKTDVFKDKVMKVYCRCQNDSLCARCGQPLYEYKLNANYYGADGHIWHVPGFCGFNHRCADLKNDIEKSPEAPFGGIELTDEHPERGPYHRRFKCAGGMRFRFEMGTEGLALYISFERYKDPEVVDRVTKGQPVEELLMLWELAHLPSVGIFTSGVRLNDGRTAEIIDSVRIDLWKAAEGRGGESEAKRIDRLVKLDFMKNEAYGEMEKQQR